MQNHTAQTPENIILRSDPGFKPKLKKSYILIRLWKYLYNYKWLLLAALILTIASNLFALIGPLLSGYAIDAIEPGKGQVKFDVVFFNVFLMMIFYFASAALSYVLAVIMIKLSRGIVYSMRKDAFDKLASLPVGFFDSHQTGDVISIISYDIDTINTSLSSDFIQVCTSLITLIGSFIMMLAISPHLILVLVVTIPVSFLFTRYMAKKVRPFIQDTV